MGCIARIGCLVLVVLLAICGWLTRDQWLPKLTGHPATSGSVAESPWQPLSPEAGSRGKRKIDENTIKTIIRRSRQLRVGMDEPLSSRIPRAPSNNTVATTRVAPAWWKPAGAISLYPFLPGQVSRRGLLWLASLMP